MAVAVVGVLVRIRLDGAADCLGHDLWLVVFLGFCALWALVKFSITLLSPPPTPGVQNAPAEPAATSVDDVF